MMVLNMVLDGNPPAEYIFCHSSGVPEVGKVCKFRENRDGAGSFYVMVTCVCDLGVKGLSTHGRTL